MANKVSDALKPLMIQTVPKYANKLFYSLGFLSATSFILLIITGTIMSINGPNWWLTSTMGKYLRSVHLWSTQAFVIFIILHLLVVFFTSAFKKPRRFTWVLGVLMLLLVLMEGEFGFVLRGDFSSQWRSLQGADFYNGSGIGYWINALSYKQIYGIHIVVVPFMIIGLLFLHYLFVRTQGIAKPYRKDITAETVSAKHGLLFARGGVLVVGVLILAFVIPSPFVVATTIQDVTKADPSLMATTLVGEFNSSSDTATYRDNIAPYTFDTRQIYIYTPYEQLIKSNPSLKVASDQVAFFQHESSAVQTQQLNSAVTFFSNWNGKNLVQNTNPAINIVYSLVGMAQTGLYEASVTAINNTATPGDTSTYVIRFLSDSGVLADKATSLNLTTDQYGMLHEEGGRAPGAWWLAPIGLLGHTVLKNDSNGDRDGALIFGSFFLLLIAFPFVPGLNQLPDKLKVYKLIWH